MVEAALEVVPQYTCHTSTRINRHPTKLHKLHIHQNFVAHDISEEIF